jgi:glutathione S-transferase
MDYRTVDEVRRMPGLRLILTAHLPGPWGEALKSVLAIKELDYVAAAQEAGGENRALVNWTGQASAPVLAWDAEPPRCGWLEQLLLAERLAPSRPLLGKDTGERVTVVGLCQEIAGEGGLGWLRRTQLTGTVIASGEAPPFMQVMADRYGYSEAAYAASEAQLVECLDWFSRRLRDQASRGSDYLVGEGLTAADLYLANFIGMLAPLSPQLNPMPESMRKAYSFSTPAQDAALEGPLLEFRDRLYRHHIKTPLEF